MKKLLAILSIGLSATACATDTFYINYISLVNQGMSILNGITTNLYQGTVLSSQIKGDGLGVIYAPNKDSTSIYKNMYAIDNEKFYEIFAGELNQDMPNSSFKYDIVIHVSQSKISPVYKMTECAVYSGGLSSHSAIGFNFVRITTADNDINKIFYTSPISVFVEAKPFQYGMIYNSWGAYKDLCITSYSKIYSQINDWAKNIVKINNYIPLQSVTVKAKTH